MFVFFSVFWLLWLAFNLFWVMFSTTNLFLAFVKYEITVKESNPDMDSMEFPAITICNVNTLSNEYVNQLPFVAEALRFSSGFDRYILHDFNFDFNDSSIKEALSSVNASLLYDEGGMMLDKMLKNCVWNSLFKRCDDIFIETMTNVGKCFTFNSANIFEKYSSNRPGTRYGLRISIVIYQNDYLVLDTSAVAGVKVTLLHAC